MRKKLPIFNYLTLGFIVIYIIAAMTVSLFRYWQGQFYYFDFGILDNAIFEVSRFRAPMIDHFELSSQKVNIFATHFYPSVFLLSPLFWLTSSPEILLIAQSLAVGLALFIGYKISKKLVKSSVATFALIIAFGGFVGLQNALVSEIHDTTLAVLPLTLCFWAIINRRWKIYFLALIILLGFKESFFGIGIGLSVYIFLMQRKDLTVALLTLLVSVLWGIVTIKFVIPAFLEGKYLYTQSSAPKTIPELLGTLVSPQIKLTSMFFSFLSFGFLPLIFLPTLTLILGQFFERFIFDFPTRWGLGFHYSATIAPILFIGSVHTISFLEKRGWIKLVKYYSWGLILLVLILHRVILDGPLGLFYNLDFYRQPTPMKSFSISIPDNLVIMTQNNLALHFTHQDVRLLRKTYDYIRPDVVLLDLSPGQTVTSFYPVSENDAKEIKESLEKDDQYPIKRKLNENVYLFAKKEF